MKTITLTSKTEIKGEDQAKRAAAYVEAHELAEIVKNEKSGKSYLVEEFEYKQASTFAELQKKYSEEEILQKFNEIRVIRLQDSKRNLLKASIEDKVTSERAKLAAISKISGLNAYEIMEKLGITL